MDRKYLTDEMAKRIQNSFRFIPKSTEDRVERYEEIRNGAKHFAFLIAKKCPPSRELSLALTALEESVMWAINSIARNEE